MELKHLLERYAGIVMDRQHFLAGKLGRHDWAADTESGMIFFDGPCLETPFEIVGTVSRQTGEWLWGWANASLPGDLARISGNIRDFGRAEHIERFTQERFPMKDDGLHALGVAACGIGGAAAYYIADYGDGILLTALTGDDALDGWSPDHPRVFTVFPQVLQSFDLDHRAALAHYLTALGYAVHDGDVLTADKDGQELAASFDSRGRLADLKGRIGA